MDFRWGFVYTKKIKKSPEKTFANIPHIKIQKYDHESWYELKNKWIFKYDFLSTHIYEKKIQYLKLKKYSISFWKKFKKKKYFKIKSKKI